MTIHDAWLRFEQGTAADLEVFLARAAPNQPIRVILAGDDWGPGACEIMAAVRPGIDLRVVLLRGAPIGDSGIEILLNSPALASVRCLGIERCGLTDRGVEHLAQSPQVQDLRELLLGNRGGIETGPLNTIGDAGAMALSASRYLSHLQRLNLWNTGVGDQGLEAIVASPYLPQLCSVSAWGTRLTREGTARIKRVAAEQWVRRKANVPGAAYCWMHTDYDERTITY